MVSFQTLDAGLVIFLWDVEVEKWKSLG